MLRPQRRSTNGIFHLRPRRREGAAAQGAFKPVRAVHGRKTTAQFTRYSANGTGRIIIARAGDTPRIERNLGPEVGLTGHIPGVNVTWRQRANGINPAAFRP